MIITPLPNTTRDLEEGRNLAKEVIQVFTCKDIELMGKKHTDKHSSRHKVACIRTLGFEGRVKGKINDLVE